MHFSSAVGNLPRRVSQRKLSLFPSVGRTEANAVGQVPQCQLRVPLRAEVSSHRTGLPAFWRCLPRYSSEEFSYGEGTIQLLVEGQVP